VCLHARPSDIAALREAAAIAADTLVFANELVKPGALTEDIDAAIREFIFDAGAYPAPLNYAGFPKSCCISLNEVRCRSCFFS
jgi:methionyl aminopeptidase